MVRLSVLVCVLSLGCQASVNAQGSAKNSGDAQSSANAQAAALEPNQTVPTPTNQPSLSSTETGDSLLPTKAQTAPAALFGARAGLHLAKGETRANCHCLGVAVGLPNDPRMRWDGQATTIDSSSQLVVTLGSEGMDCPDAPKDSLGASYHGYETVGADVTIYVETGRMGRPQAAGAIVPRPASGGHVLVRPVDNKTPYGRSLDGKSASCVVWTAP